MAIAEIGSVAVSGNRHPIAAQLYTVDAKVLEIEWIVLVSTGEVCVVQESNDHQVRQLTRKHIVEIVARVVLRNR